MLAFMLAMVPLMGSSGVASAQDGLQKDQTYESPQFGYTVTWDDDWSVRARDVISNRGGYDTLVLRGTVGTLLIQGQGTDVSAADAVTSRVMIEGNVEDIVNQVLDGDVPMTEMVAGRTHILIEGYTLETNDATVLIVLSAREKDFQSALDLVHDQIEFNGGDILTGEDVIEGNGEDVTDTPEPTVEVTEVATEEPVDTATETPVDLVNDTSGMDEGTFTGEIYGYTFDFDPDMWEVDLFVDAGTRSDGLKLSSDTGVLTIWSWDAYGADPVACLEGEAGYYADEDPTVDDWAPALDANGDPIRYETDDYAYGVYTLTYTDPDVGASVELTDYMECRTIPGEDAVVIIFGLATPDVYNDHLDDVLDVAETIHFTNEVPSEATEPSTPPVEDELPETGFSGSLYTSPSFGFMLDLPVQWSLEDEILTVNEERLMVTNGTSDVLIRATTAYTADLAGCIDFAAENAPHDLELMTTAQGTPFRGDDRNGAYGNFEYDNGDEAYSIFCQYINEGESVLILAQDVPADELASQRTFRIDLQQSIEMP